MLSTVSLANSCFVDIGTVVFGSVFLASAFFGNEVFDGWREHYGHNRVFLFPVLKSWRVGDHCILIPGTSQSEDCP